MSLEATALQFVGEKSLIPIGLAALIVMLAVWLTRLDDRVTYQEARIKSLEKVCYHSKVWENSSQGE